MSCAPRREGGSGKHELRAEEGGSGKHELRAEEGGSGKHELRAGHCVTNLVLALCLSPPPSLAHRIIHRDAPFAATMVSSSSNSGRRRDSTNTNTSSGISTGISISRKSITGIRGTFALAPSEPCLASIADTLPHYPYGAAALPRLIAHDTAAAAAAAAAAAGGGGLAAPQCNRGGLIIIHTAQRHNERMKGTKYVSQAID
jgi:hypothetical protein